MNEKQTYLHPGTSRNAGAKNTGVKNTVESQFSQVAGNYRTSAVHATGPELDEIIQMVTACRARTLLDAGCGPGHTALTLAPVVDHVTAIDLSNAMLDQGRQLVQERGITNVEFRQGDVEDLPFPDGSFDVVTTRYSAHHWPDPRAALAEFHRVLRNNDDTAGRLILADVVSFADFTLDTHVQTIELLRDPSHVRDHTPDQWIDMLLAAGFQTNTVFRWDLPLNFDSWVERMATPLAAVEQIKAILANAPDEVRAGLSVQPDSSFTFPCAIFQATRIAQ